jgi:hypothetical protein
MKSLKIEHACIKSVSRRKMSVLGSKVRTQNFILVVFSFCFSLGLN